MKIDPDRQAERRMESMERHRRIEEALPFVRESLGLEIGRLFRKMVAEEVPTHDELLDIRAGFRACHRIAVNMEHELDLADRLGKPDEGDI